MEWLISTTIIVLLILLNGIFVAAEFAIIGVPRAAIERRVTAGESSASLVQTILRDPLRQDRYIATAQLGITLASLGLGMYGEHALAQGLVGWLEELGTSRWITAHTLASILAISVLTYFHIVLGEMVPKSLALMHAEDTALRIIRPMLWAKFASYPLIIALNGLGNAILRLMGIKRQLSGSHYYTAEELQLIVEESEESGTLNSEAGQMLRELLELSGRTAEEVMTPRVHITGIPIGASPNELTTIINRAHHTRYPVFDSTLDQIVGFIHIKDVLRLLVADCSVQQEDSRPLSFVPETATVDSVLAAMRRAHTHMVVIIDEYGGTSGIVTIEDLCEEIVGEIEEEVDDSLTPFVDAQGGLHVPGIWRLDEVSEELGLDTEISHEEVDTLGGLVLHLLDHEPTVGDIVTYGGIHIKVAALEGHGVQWCVLTPESEKKPE
ncbi:MAG: hemolysin family protein [Candidatus Nitrosoglobus sp.]